MAARCPYRTASWCRRAKANCRSSTPPSVLRSQERIRFRYMLETSTTIGPKPCSGASPFTNLPPGKYRFRVQAFEMNMPESVTEASLDIDWRPHFYRTRWFLAACAGLVLAGVLMAYRLRLRQVHARFRAVLEERNRVAREMHDTVIQGCASVSALLEAVLPSSTDATGSGRELLDCARTQVRATVDEARRAVWNLRQSGGIAARDRSAAGPDGPAGQQCLARAGSLRDVRPAGPARPGRGARHFDGGARGCI